MLIFFKIAILVFAFALVAPLFAILIRRYSAVRDWCFVLMILSTSTYIGMNLLPMPLWKGTARGFAIYAVDFLSFSLLCGLLFIPGFKFNWRPPGLNFYLLYCGLSFISFFSAAYRVQCGFEILKMFWMYIFFLAAYNYIILKRSFWPLVHALVIAVFIMFAVADFQRYALHIYQIRSTLPHQNSLSLYGTMCVCILLGVLFNEKTTSGQSIMLFIAFLCAVLLVYFSLSRAGLVLMFFGVAVTTALTFILNGFAVKRGVLLTIFLIGASIMLLMAAGRIRERFTTASDASGQTRINLAKAAARMANDYTLGVGLNNFSVYSSSKYDYAREQYEEGISYEDKAYENGPIVETIYLLVAAECGWVTLGVLLLWFGSYWWWSLGLNIALKHQPCFGIMAGICGGLSANYNQSTLEWVLKQYSNFYLLMLVFAVIAVLRQHQRDKKLT
jgi:hypothetical protein